MNVKKELYRRIELYHRLDVACDVALMLLVAMLCIAMQSIEHADITWRFFAVIAGLLLFAGMVLLVKRIAWVQQKIAADRLMRREAWERCVGGAR